MPAAYAHMVFGMEVTAILPISAQESINRHPELFGIGLQGPDILFYYHPSETQAYVLYGHNIHKRPAADFFRYALVQLEKLAELEKEKAIAYLMGFLCHFILDSNCHPIVRKHTFPGEASHRQIEREFDRFLMEKDKIRPVWFIPWTKTVPMAEKHADIIALFYPEAGEQVIRRGIRNMRLYESVTTGYRMRSRLELTHISEQLEERMISQRHTACEVIRIYLLNNQVGFMSFLDRNFG